MRVIYSFYESVRKHKLADKFIAKYDIHHNKEGLNSTILEIIHP